MARPKHSSSEPLSDDRIKAAAWEQLARHGIAGLSLRGIARRLGVTAPAIYNYFGRLEDLITALVVDAFTDLAEAMKAAEAAETSERCYGKIVALCLAYRQWAVDHPVHFQLIYGSPIPGYLTPVEVAVPLARWPFLGMLRWFVHGYEMGELSVPAEYREVPPKLAERIGAWKRQSGMALPDALVVLLMSGWSRIHGAVMLELFGHVDSLVGEAAEFFWHEIEAFVHQMGLVGQRKLRLRSMVRNELHVVFGAGPVGRAVAQELVRLGKAVRVVSLSGQMQEVPQGAEVVAANLYDLAAVRAVTQGAAVAYQCAQPYSWERAEKFPPMQVAILEGLDGTGTRLVIAENLCMYGAPDSRVLTEDLPYRAQTRRGKVRARMAEAALDAHRAGKVPVALGRASDCFGPWALGSSHGGRVFFPALAGKTANFSGKLDLPHTTTYIRDFGRALVMLGNRDEALGQAWHVPNDRPWITQRQFGGLVFQEIGFPPRMRGTRKWRPRLDRLSTQERAMAETATQFKKPFVVDSSKFERVLGLKPTPLPEAIAETVAWYRRHPDLASN